MQLSLREIMDVELSYNPALNYFMRMEAINSHQFAIKFAALRILLDNSIDRMIRRRNSEQAPEECDATAAK